MISVYLLKMIVPWSVFLYMSDLSLDINLFNIYREEHTVATKIIQQAVTLFSLTLYLLYSKSYSARVCICL